MLGVALKGGVLELVGVRIHCREAADGGGPGVNSSIVEAADGALVGSGWTLRRRGSVELAAAWDDVALRNPRWACGGAGRGRRKGGGGRRKGGGGGG